MAWGARWYLVGSILLGVLGVLAGCSGNMFAEREPWRHEAEVQCINAGAVKEGPGVVRVKAIRGPGMCGADFPLKVSSLGESAPLGYTDDPRPPGAIPGRPEAVPPRWPIRSNEVTRQELPPPSRVLPPYQPRSQPLVGPYQPNGAPPVAPVVRAAPGDHAAPGAHDFRRPYGALPREDFSPEPYERRPLIDAPAHVRSSPREPPFVPQAAAGMPPDAARRAPQATVAPSWPGPVAVSPTATLACPIVSALDQWVSSSVQPAAMRWFGVPVAEITQISAYSCRGMNGNPRARISEHAFGNALDIAAFTLADGRKITVKAGWNGLPEEQGFLRDIQAAACDQFTTVLAPGSNVYHYDHIHVDLMRRSGRACNPSAVSGDVVAARAGARYGARRGDPSVTGSIAQRQALLKRLRLDPDADVLPALPMAEPGNDGED